VTGITEVRSVSAGVACAQVTPLVSVIATAYYVTIIVPRAVWYRALSVRYACIRSLDIILIP